MNTKTAYFSKSQNLSDRNSGNEKNAKKSDNNAFQKLQLSISLLNLQKINHFLSEK